MYQKPVAVALVVGGARKVVVAPGESERERDCESTTSTTLIRKPYVDRGSSMPLSLSLSLFFFTRLDLTRLELMVAKPNSSHNTHHNIPDTALLALLALFSPPFTSAPPPPPHHHHHHHRRCVCALFSGSQQGPCANAISPPPPRDRVLSIFADQTSRAHTPHTTALHELALSSSSPPLPLSSRSSLSLLRQRSNVQPPCVYTNDPCEPGPGLCFGLWYRCITQLCTAQMLCDTVINLLFLLKRPLCTAAPLSRSSFPPSFLLYSLPVNL